MFDRSQLIFVQAGIIGHRGITSFQAQWGEAVLPLPHRNCYLLGFIRYVPSGFATFVYPPTVVPDGWL
jgi:hypothetical protein